jgi:hypothetical protein
MVDRLVWDGLFDGRFADRDHAVGVFERHIDHVRASCPPERLLVFDVAEGWEPLCEFLDVPVPAKPFPRLNDAKVIRRRVALLRWGTRGAPIVAASAIVGLAVRRQSRSALANAYCSSMGSKAPPSGQNKKQGKTLKEKRAAKKAKKAENSKRTI